MIKRTLLMKRLRLLLLPSILLPTALLATTPSTGKSDDWYKDDLKYAVKNGLIVGFPDGSLKPNAYATRAQLIVVATKLSKRIDELQKKIQQLTLKNRES